MGLPPRGAAIGIGVLAAAALAAALLWDEDAPADPAPLAGLSPGALVAPPDPGLPPAGADWRFSFPADHGAHPGYPTEAWSLTGLLDGGQGGTVAVSLDLLRVDLRTADTLRASPWAASGVYAAVLAYTDPATGRLRVAHRLSRSALGLAGTAADPLRLWVEDWRLKQVAKGAGPLALRAVLADGDAMMDLELVADGPPVEGGGSGAQAPFAFYRLPRLDAEGALGPDGSRVTLSGRFALEHAWGELPLPGGPVARDRFTLFLDDGRSLALVRTHRADGTGTPWTVGQWIEADGSATELPRESIELTPVEYWSSGETGARYPIAWRLALRQPAAEFRLVAERADQEGLAWAPFWAGPVRLEGGPPGAGVMILSGYEGMD